MAAGTGGWIKVHRCLCENWLWSDRPFSKGQAWIDLLLMANHEPHRLKTRTGFVELERGSFHTEERSLAARWGWSREKVRNFWRALVDDGMIEYTVKKSTTGKTSEGTTIKVLNYGVYQAPDTSKKTTEKTTKKPTTDQRETNDRPKQEVFHTEIPRMEEVKAPLAEALDDFAEHRRKLKKPMTDRAKKLLLADLDKLAETDREKIAIIEQSILQGWAGLFPLRQQVKQTTFENLDAGRL